MRCHRKYEDKRGETLAEIMRQVTDDQLHGVVGKLCDMITRDMEKVCPAPPFVRLALKTWLWLSDGMLSGHEYSEEETTAFVKQEWVKEVELWNQAEKQRTLELS